MVMLKALENDKQSCLEKWTLEWGGTKNLLLQEKGIDIVKTQTQKVQRPHVQELARSAEDQAHLALVQSPPPSSSYSQDCLDPNFLSGLCDCFLFSHHSLPRPPLFSSLGLGRLQCVPLVPAPPSAACSLSCPAPGPPGRSLQGLFFCSLGASC